MWLDDLDELVAELAQRINEHRSVLTKSEFDDALCVDQPATGRPWLGSRRPPPSANRVRGILRERRQAPLRRLRDVARQEAVPRRRSQEPRHKTGDWRRTRSRDEVLQSVGQPALRPDGRRPLGGPRQSRPPKAGLRVRRHRGPKQERHRAALVVAGQFQGNANTSPGCARVAVCAHRRSRCAYQAAIQKSISRGLSLHPRRQSASQGHLPRRQCG